MLGTASCRFQGEYAGINELDLYSGNGRINVNALLPAENPWSQAFDL